MNVVIRSELARFKTWALAFSGLHLLVLILINSLTGLMRNSVANLLMFGVIYIGAATVFGIYQFASLKKPNQWAYLIHRPMSISKIFNSLISVGLGLFAAVFVIPLAIFFVGLDLFSQQVVEWRHYAFLPLVMLVMINFYLAACFAVLHPKRIALVALFAPFVFLYGFGEGYSIFVWLMVSGLVFLLMARLAFKADLEANLNKPNELVVTVVPIQLSLYATLAFISFIGGQMLLYAFNIHPFVNPTPDSYYQVHRNISQSKSMLWALQGANQQDIDNFEAQVAISEIDTLGSSMREFPIRQTRHQPHINDKNGFFPDRERQIIWTFNHQQMLYKGSLIRGDDPGWLGQQGVITDLKTVTEQDRFDAVPIVEAGVIVTQNRVYQWDAKQQRLAMRFQLPKGEEFYSAPEMGANYVALFSNKAMYLFDKRQVDGNLNPVQPFSRLSLPREISHLITPRISELASGYLVSLAFGDPRLSGSYIDTENYLYYLDYSGSTRLVNQREMNQSVPAWHRYNDFIIAPLFALAEQWAEQNRNPVQGLEPVGWMIIAIVELLIAVLAGFVLLNSALSPARKLFWFVAAVLGGIPGLLTLWFLSDWRHLSTSNPSQAKLHNQLANA